MWKLWWVSKLRETAPNVRTLPSDSLKEILAEIVLTSQAQAHNKIITLTSRFWMFQPENNSTIQGFIKEYQIRFYDLKEHSSFSPETKIQMKNLLLFHLSNLQPELANRHRSLSLELTISQCLGWISENKQKSKPHQNQIVCNFCKIQGHREHDCRKKKKSENGMNKTGTQNIDHEKIFTLGNVE